MTRVFYTIAGRWKTGDAFDRDTRYGTQADASYEMHRLWKHYRPVGSLVEASVKEHVEKITTVEVLITEREK